MPYHWTGLIVLNVNVVFIRKVIVNISDVNFPSFHTSWSRYYAHRTLHYIPYACIPSILKYDGNSDIVPIWHCQTVKDQNNWYESWSVLHLDLQLASLRRRSTLVPLYSSLRQQIFSTPRKLAFSMSTFLQHIVLDVLIKRLYALMR